MSFSITDLRLANQRLTGEKFNSPEQAVAHLGAVQSQDFAAAKWALGLRCQNATDQSIEKAFNQGKILRTHIMRPTWHFVTPQNIKWMQQLTAHRVLASNKHMAKKLELDEPLLAKCHIIIADLLRGHAYATRAEIASELEKHGIVARSQRLAYIVMHAELHALICSGPRRGKQFTYALLEERAPNAQTLPTEEALAKLTLTYFTSHGPAQLKDFSWWSGLTMKEVQAGFELVKKDLHSEEIDGKTYWFNEVKKTAQISPQALLLSIFDEYTIAYKDRTDFSHKRDIERMLAMGAALTSVIVIDGKVLGTWKRVITKKVVSVTTNFFIPITAQQHQAVQQSAEKYVQFLNVPDLGITF